MLSKKISSKSSDKVCMHCHLVEFSYHASFAMVWWLKELACDQVALCLNPSSATLFNRTSCSIFFSLSAPFDKEWGNNINQKLDYAALRDLKVFTGLL